MLNQVSTFHMTFTNLNSPVSVSFVYAEQLHEQTYSHTHHQSFSQALAMRANISLASCIIAARKMQKSRKMTSFSTTCADALSAPRKSFVASTPTDVIMGCFQIPARLFGSVMGAEAQRPPGKGTIAI